MPVLDASVVVDWVAPAHDADSAERRLLGRLIETGAELHAPHLLIQETADTLLSGVRRRHWTAAQADESFTILDRLPIVRHAENNDLERAWDLARRYDEHPFYDMVYVAMAERLGMVLITSDKRLRNRVRRPGLVVGPDDWSADA